MNYDNEMAAIIAMWHFIIGHNSVGWLLSVIFDCDSCLTRAINLIWLTPKEKS